MWMCAGWSHDLTTFVSRLYATKNCRMGFLPMTTSSGAPSEFNEEMSARILSMKGPFLQFFPLRFPSYITCCTGMMQLDRRLLFLHGCFEHPQFQFFCEAYSLPGGSFLITSALEWHLGLEWIFLSISALEWHPLHPLCVFFCCWVSLLCAYSYTLFWMVKFVFQ